MLINTTPEKSASPDTAAAKGALIVTQPKQLENILAAIADVERVSETQGGVASGDWSGSGGQTGSGQTSARDEAIARLPDPPLMQRALKQHIEQEILTLRRQAKRLTRVSTPGAAFELNELYGKIRRLNGLIFELFNASVEVLRRLFIRVFVDRQSI